MFPYSFRLLLSLCATNVVVDFLAYVQLKFNSNSQEESAENSKMGIRGQRATRVQNASASAKYDMQLRKCER